MIDLFGRRKLAREIERLKADAVASADENCANRLRANAAERELEAIKAKADLQLIDEAIEAHFGERCPDADPECMTCRAWAYLDKISGRSKPDGGRAAE
ncbi:hypothetical protein [Pseudomonas monteilii]|uniref:hypothetical protein n=1 Tax=Pseudomonas monteilii TaxID=76759 RepID=UPI0013788F80|nr:hypothetical protein [Pseudomonas monteilii]NBB07877.1 hypothetical protein [Pseudomonas monteilii]